MNIRKVIQRRIRFANENVDVAGDVNAVIAANVGEGPSTTHVTSKQTAATGGAHARVPDEEDQREEPQAD